MIYNSTSFHNTRDHDYPAGWFDEFVETTAKGERLFALRVRGDSMFSEFKEGEVIIVNPDLEVIHGDYGIVKILETGETTLKRIEFYGGTVVLRPVNPADKTIQIKEGRKQIRIVGIVLRAEREY